MRERRPRALILASLLLPAVLGHAQLADRLSVRGAVEAVVPVFGDEQYFTTGVGGALAAGFAVLPFLQPFVTAGFASQPLRGADQLSISEAGIGAALTFSPLERLELRVEGVGGLYAAYRGDLGAGGALLSARGEIGFRVSPSLSISARGGIERYFGPGSPLLTAATAGLCATLHIDGLAVGGGRLRIEDVKVGSVYPVFYSWYDDNSFGAVSLVNAERYEARDVRVSFSVGRYMAQPKQCAAFPSIAPGGSVNVSLNALFTDEVLSLTEATRAPGALIVDYSVLGSRRQVRAPLVQRFFHRNAMNWDDDRKAAAFVSPTDPAALWFAKYVSGIVRRRARAGVSLELQLAMGILETERLFGLAYVVDPNSSYVEKSADESAVDYLQFPHQTLFYRGGDCDDLSILFAALLESVGVHTAFVTIPGHIFMAFKLRMSEAEARAAFFDPSLLIFRDGEAWVPVEITMVKEGFVKAWRIGAKEWADNARAGTASFFPMQQSWALFPPVGIPDVNPRFSLPDEALVIQAFDESVNRFVAREIDPAVREHRARADGADAPLAANELGILYGRYGLLKEAWEQFSLTAKSPLVFGWTNLGSVAFLRADYELALTYYQWALGLDPRDPAATLGVARSQYELERFDEAGAAHAGLRQLDPALALKYGYLSSAMGGEGRAWSFSDRLTTTVWDEPVRLVAARPAAPPVEPPPGAPPPVEAPLVEELPVEALPVAAAPLEAPPVEPAPVETPRAQAPPAVAAQLPKDAELLAVAVIQPEPEPVQSPVPEPAPEPIPAPAPEPAAEPATEPAAEPEPVLLAAVVRAAEPPEPELPPPPPVVEATPPAPPEADERQLLFRGFDGAVPLMGRWRLSLSGASQSNPAVLTGKLAVPLVQPRSPLQYTVTARSQGSGWVGLGLHLMVSSAQKHRGWGEGRSILVWLTSDPKHRDDSLTRLQIYRSSSDIDMTMEQEVVVAESVFDPNEISVRVDPVEGQVTVSLNGTERLSCGGFSDLDGGVAVVFRALDRAEFQDFRVEELP